MCPLPMETAHIAQQAAQTRHDAIVVPIGRECEPCVARKIMAFHCSKIAHFLFFPLMRYHIIDKAVSLML